MKPTTTFFIFLAFVILVILVLWFLSNKSNVQKTQSTSSSSSGISVSETTEQKFNRILQEMKDAATANYHNPQGFQTPLNYQTLVATMAANGITVVKQGDTYSMQYDPNRVVVKEIQINCLIPPCFNDFQVVSVG